MAWNKPNHRGGSGFLPGPNFGRQIDKPLAARTSARESAKRLQSVGTLNAVILRPTFHTTLRDVMPSNGGRYGALTLGR
jgi:hypothetical protein